MTTDRPNLADHLPEELPALFAAHGLTLDEAKCRKVYAAAVGRGEADLSRVTAIAIPTRRAIETAFAFPRIEIVERKASPTDGFMKYLLRLQDGALVEAVRIPIPCEPPSTPEGLAARELVKGTWKGTRRRYVLCVSSQVGCALGCAFCATATMGFVRNLTPAEIIAQVLAVRAEADRPVQGVVFMGMGEPFLNYDAVVKAARILSNPCGLAIAAEDITISTAGIVPAIRRFTAEGHRFRLAVSLTSARPERRKLLMPIERKYATAELVAAARDHAQASRERVTFAYVAIGGPEGNTSAEDAAALAALLSDVPCRVDLIDVNGGVGGYRPPTDDERRTFLDILDTQLKRPIARRYSGGKDIDAACGMLATQST